jgi:CHAT domain-containing protein
MALNCPFGRVVTTGQVPRGARDPVTEDARLRILAVANPTQDLAASEAEIDALTALAGPVGGVTVEVTVLEREAATVAAFRAAVEGQDYELLHFAGHATFDGRDPLASALLLADGTIAADELGALAWSAPPYVVFNSACSSARAGARRQLVSPRGRSNGLAAAFLSAGVEAYLGHYWPVSDSSARQVSDCFYRSLFERRNIGQALLEARCQAATAFHADRDLTALGLVYFGDSGTAERRDTVTMAT